MWDEIKKSISISDVLRSYGYHVPDRDSYRIQCPIHHGDGFNFSVSDRDGLWNCFSGCGRGGSVIDLVAALEGIEPKEAVKKLARDFNIAPAAVDAIVAREYMSKNERFNVWRDTKREDHDIELPLYLVPLEEGYRGLRQSTIDHWGLARLRHGWRGESNPLLPPEGIFIPLHNTRSGFCSYSIRTNSGDPKYWNAPGQSRCPLMGLYKNKEDIIKAGFVYVCEGQFDCISLWQRGFRNVVALRGSSLGEPRAMLLLSLTSNLKLLLDSDAPGKAAAEKLKNQWNKVFDITIIDLPEGKDPDELTNEELNRLLA